ncbi:MAG: DUF4878 domain-containing protein [Bacteroidales bacterium]
MKKIIFLVLAAFSILLYTGCSGTPEPGKAAMKYMTYLQKGEYRKFAENVAVNPKNTAAQQEENIQLSEALLKEKVGETFAKKGGIKKLKLISESVAEDGQSAKVVINVTYGNGDVDDETVDLVLQDKKWKMKSLK